MCKFVVNSFNFADIVHNYGLYLPNNQDITNTEIEFISKIVNKYTNDNK